MKNVARDVDYEENSSTIGLFEPKVFRYRCNIPEYHPLARIREGER